MNKAQTTSPAQDGTTKPRRLGRGLSALLGEPVAVQLPSTPSTIATPQAPAAVVEPKYPHAPHTQRATPHSPTPATSSSSPTTPRTASPAPAASSSPAPADEPTKNRVVQIPVDQVEPNRFQPRRTFDEAQLNELAASIKSAGVVQPVLVRALGKTGAPSGGPSRYEIVAGERRWRASKLAGLSHVPAVIADLSDEQCAEWALIENIQRADLSAMERAWAIKGLCERFGLSHTQVAEKLGIDRSSAANLARLTELEKDIQDLLDSGNLSAGHGKVLVGLPAGAVRVGLARQAATQGWSVRRLEQAAQRATESPQGPAPNVKIPDGALAKAAALKDLERQLGEHLGTSVRIRASAGGKRGSLVVKFFDLDHFDGLMTKMGFVLR